MGEQNVTQGQDTDELRQFTKKLLADLRAFELMLDNELFESGVSRIGAEQEMFLADSSWQPALKALDVLERIDDEHFTTELGRFNLECNLDPIALGGDCLRQLENQLLELLHKAATAAEKEGCQVVLTGILPTLDKSDLGLEAMTPRPRYRALNEAMNRLRNGKYHLRLKGRDEIDVTHDNVMLEACNTSFQVHFQVSPENFVNNYNVAQLVAAPTLAAATNSPLLFGRQLWRETRIALFQQSVDTRSPTDHLREQSPRVSFGRDWVRDSALEIFREDIARFRVLLSIDVDEDPFEVLRAGGVPKLDALRLHNGTIYRWNRLCYGISNGLPHMRIENRVLPSGPTPLDEVANAAFWFGLMSGVSRQYADVRKELDFSCAAENFVSAARLGLGAHFDWPGRRHVSASELILEELLPLAREGLDRMEIDSADRDRYLDVIEERVKTLKTGSQWILDSLAAMKSAGTKSECLSAVVAGTIRRQRKNEPVHGWPVAELSEAGDSRSHYMRVDQLMVTDLFTVGEDELVDRVACVMNWQHVRHVPVEDKDHRLVGLVTHRSLLRLMGDSLSNAGSQAVPVHSIMQRDVITVTPDTPSLDAIQLMRKHKISCLPVVSEDDRLIGMVTERDFMNIAAQLLEKYLST